MACGDDHLLARTPNFSTQATNALVDKKDDYVWHAGTIVFGTCRRSCIIVCSFMLQSIVKVGTIIITSTAQVAQHAPRCAHAIQIAMIPVDSSHDWVFFHLCIVNALH